MKQKRNIPAYVFGSAKAAQTAKDKLGQSRVKPLPTADEMMKKAREAKERDMDDDEEMGLLADARRIGMKFWNDELKRADHRVVAAVVNSLLAMYIAGFSTSQARKEVYKRSTQLVATLVSQMTGEPLITGGDFETVMSNQVAEQIADDPELGEMVRDTTSRLKQVLQGVDMMDREAVAKAMESIGMQPVDEDEIEEIERKLNEKPKQVN